MCSAGKFGVNLRFFGWHSNMSTLIWDLRPPGMMRPRDGLHLSLNRSLSEPGPADVSPKPPPSPSSTTGSASCPKLLCPSNATAARRNKADCVSLPPSPCSDSCTFQKSLILKKVREMDADTFCQKLMAASASCAAGGMMTAASAAGGGDASRPFLIVDCRSFIAYNINHVRGAVNVNCSDRFNRRRLQQGKATLADLTSTKEAKAMLKRRCYRDVIVYDEGTCDVRKLTTTHPLFIIFTSLIEDNREPIMLIGEWNGYLLHVMLLFFKSILKNFTGSLVTIGQTNRRREDGTLP